MNALISPHRFSRRTILKGGALTVGFALARVRTDAFAQGAVMAPRVVDPQEVDSFALPPIARPCLRANAPRTKSMCASGSAGRQGWPCPRKQLASAATAKSSQSSSPARSARTTILMTMRTTTS